MLLRTAASVFFPQDNPPKKGVVRATHCWFCGKSLKEVKKMVEAQAPPGIAPCAICDECVRLCIDLMGDAVRVG